MHRFVANARPNMPLVATVSMRALIGFGRCFRKSFAQLGTKPQLICGSSRCPWRCRTAYTGSVGATFQLGARPAWTSPVSSSTCSVRAASSPTSSGSRSAVVSETTNLPHMRPVCPAGPTGAHLLLRWPPRARRVDSFPSPTRTGGKRLLALAPEAKSVCDVCPRNAVAHYAVAQDIGPPLQGTGVTIEQVAGSGGLRVDPPRVRLHRDRGRLDLDEPEPRRRRCQLRRRVVVPRRSVRRCGRSRLRCRSVRRDASHVSVAGVCSTVLADRSSTVLSR